MPVFLFTAADGDVSTMDNVFTSLTSIFTFIVELLGKVVTLITSNPLIFVPVIIAFAGGALMLAVSFVHRLGVGSGGRRRHGRR